MYNDTACRFFERGLWPSCPWCDLFIGVSIYIINQLYIGFRFSFAVSNDIHQQVLRKRRLQFSFLFFSLRVLVDYVYVVIKHSSSWSVVEYQQNVTTCDHVTRDRRQSRKWIWLTSEKYDWQATLSRLEKTKWLAANSREYGGMRRR